MEQPDTALAAGPDAAAPLFNSNQQQAQAPPPRDDPRVEFIRKLVLRTFPAVKIDSLHRLFASDAVATMLFEFLHVPDARLLLFTDHGNETSEALRVYATPPPRLFGESPVLVKPTCVLYMVKSIKGAVSLDRCHEEILTGTMERNALESLAHILHEILIPLIGNPRNQRMWPEMVTTSVLNNIHGFFSSLQITVGQTRGATCLPLPWDQSLTDNTKAITADTGSCGPHSRGGSNNKVVLSGVAPLSTTQPVLPKDQVHSLEGCLITWTKQIKNILKQDPEVMLNHKHHLHPGPMEELAFWRSKARNLNSVFAQLQSDSVRKVLHYLDASKSTYNVPFAKLCKDVFVARAEANDNVHFLQPMATWFERLDSGGAPDKAPTLSGDSEHDGLGGADMVGDDTARAEATAAFLEIRDFFRPICHSLLLVWKCSRFYNTPTRLVVLIRQICNSIIRRATAYLSGATLFVLIDQDQLDVANDMLLRCLQVCAHFKSVYFDYKARSVTQVAGNPWRIQNNALFIRLDAFLERCHDVLELTQTIDQFQRLSSMEIGGTKGKTLTASVHQIFADFQDTLVHMKTVSYDLMDLDAKQFEDDFYTFRSRNKELERRLASVINQAFDDAKTITGRFKCLDCFSDLLDRPIIKNELERKHTALLTSYAHDVHVVQQIFVENRESPPIPPNLPPFAGAVTWCRGLAERIRFPMEKVKLISPRVVLEREESKDAIKLYTNVMAMLQEYEAQMVKKWGVSVETSSKAKLKLPLIRREAVAMVGGALGPTPPPSTTTQQLAMVEMAAVGTGVSTSGTGGFGGDQLFVNFDAALVQLLREVKYFLLLGLEIPEDALAIYKRAEVFRRQTGNLELIVDLYNNIHATLLPVERPLVKNYLDRMDHALTKGIKALNWKSHGIDLFLKESMTDVNDANTLLSQLKAHQTRVGELLTQWASPPLLFERRSKPLSVGEFGELQRSLCQVKYHVIKEGGNEIHRLLKDALKYLRVSQGSPDWRAYVDYMSALVEDGLTQVILKSLANLRDQLDPARIERDDLSALIEVELDLYGKDVVYAPTIQSTGATRAGLRDVVMQRVEAILLAATVFKRLDSADGSYLKEMRENVTVQQLVAEISGFLDSNERACAAYRTELAKYEYLWTTDLPVMFTQFLATAWQPPASTAPIAVEQSIEGSASGGGSSSAIVYCDAYPTVNDIALRKGTYSISSSSGGGNRKASVVPAATTTIGLAPPMPAQLLDLPRFEERIHFFLALQNEISESKHARDVGFVRVNSLPIKQALSTWVTKWIYMFTQYLHDRVVNQLAWLDQFMTRVSVGLDDHAANATTSVAPSSNSSDPKDSNVRDGAGSNDNQVAAGGGGGTSDEQGGALMASMHHIRDVRRLMREDLLVNFGKLKEIVHVLKLNGIALELSYIGKENVLSFLEHAPLRWEQMVNKTFKKKELIQPMQVQMVERIRVEIADFQRRLLALKSSFPIDAPIAAPTRLAILSAPTIAADRDASIGVLPATGTCNESQDSIDDAYEQLDTYDAMLSNVEREATRLVELEDMFELAPSKYDALTALRSDLVQLKHVWDLVALQRAVYAQWQRLPWAGLDTDVLLLEADSLMEWLVLHRVGGGSGGGSTPLLQHRVRTWPVFQFLTQELEQMTVVVPLIKHLHSPAMRERHWKSLMVLTRKHFEPPTGGYGSGSASGSSSSGTGGLHTALRLEEVLRLELHRFVNEVNELVEVANREFKIEQQLQAIETAWHAFTLEFVPYKTAQSGAQNSQVGSRASISSTVTSSSGTAQPSTSSLVGVRVDENDEDDDCSDSDDGNSSDGDSAGNGVVGGGSRAGAAIKSSLVGADGDIAILKAPTAIVECLEEHQLQLQTMVGMGKFVAYFKDKVFDWQQRLGDVDVVLKLWLALQRQWCSLEAIFLSSVGDIQTQLPQELARFQHIDAEMKELFMDAVAHPSVLVACTQREGRELVLRELHSELEICQRALNQYLDGKKDIFPRFYFVSNALLLEILSNGNAPPRLQPHFGHCFDGIRSFEFERVGQPPGTRRTSNAPASGSVTAPIPHRSTRISLSGGVAALAAIDQFVALAMTSKEGEIVRFADSHVIHGAVENWFNDLVRVMQDTLRQQLAMALESSSLWGIDADQARHAWVFEYPAQVALLASQIVWTEEVEGALEELESGGNEDALKKYSELCTCRLEALITVVQGSLALLDRAKIITLITIDVHARDVVSGLIAKQVTSSLDFPWQSQLRYYPAVNGGNSGSGGPGSAGGMAMSASGGGTSGVGSSSTGSGAKVRDVVIKICDFRAFYAFEYTGNCGRLVITPLTDRCYVTLTTALRLCLGGAPAGPAGTGKTETTKDLARGLGLQCYVFNCSEQMNYKTMAEIFRGLAQTGAWGCFDEFNRISVEVLSVVATQVKTVLDATVSLAATLHRVATACSSTSSSSNTGQGSSMTSFDGGGSAMLPGSTSVMSGAALAGTFEFFGRTITLIPTVGLFITMNPGYAGRAELPENLKALFRSCAMIKPDLQPICENMLMAEGFLRARVLSIKFVTLYELSRELLSKQTHYDWGLRAVKSVLLVAGALRRKAASLSSSSGTSSAAAAAACEERVLMQVLRDFNTPKILASDAPVFLGLLNDLFPNHTLPRANNDALRESCVSICSTQRLQPEDGFLRKVLELEDVLAVRHSVMLIGPAGCGKTTIWRTLAACHNVTQTKPVTVYESVNPKAVTADELYGFMTLDNDWKDGVLSALMRSMANHVAPSFSAVQTAQWVVLDGDIDAGWIESMNTVMDDNKVLTLVSNERIPLTPAMRLMFEVHSLQNATPATVSRAGIIYVNEHEIGWAPFAESWVQRRFAVTSTTTQSGVNSTEGSRTETKDTAEVPSKMLRGDGAANDDDDVENSAISSARLHRHPGSPAVSVESALLPALFAKYVDALLAMLREHKLAPVVPLPPLAMVATLCHLLEGLLARVNNANKTPERIENAFLYCACWAFGGALDSEQSKVFSTQFKALAKFKVPAEIGNTTPSPSLPATGGAARSTGANAPSVLTLLHTLSVFEICFDIVNNTFVPWRDHVTPLGIQGSTLTGGVGSGSSGMLDAAAMQNVIVPTLESTRLHALLDLLLPPSSWSSSTSPSSSSSASSTAALSLPATSMSSSIGSSFPSSPVPGFATPILLVGSSGSGKSVLLAEHLKNAVEADPDELSSVHLVLHHFMDARELQLRLERHVEKRSGRMYGPLQNRKLVYFLDDLNMPHAEQYGTQTAMALLRQFMDYGAWFDRQDLSVKKQLQDVAFVAAMNHKNGSFAVNPRLQRHFATFMVAMPGKEDLVTIYSTLFASHLASFAERLQKLGPALVSASIELYLDVRRSFLPTAAKFHYVFSLRELSALFRGLTLARGDTYPSSAPAQLGRLWLHECFRVFSDRMATASEVQRFAELALEQAKKYWEEDPAALFTAPLVCANFLHQPVHSNNSGTDGNSSKNGPSSSNGPSDMGDSASAPGSYIPVSDRAQLVACLTRQLQAYNECHPVMHLVLFDQALEHVTRIARVLAQSRGHALLIGVGGSGKQSLARLAAFICGLAVHQLSLASATTYTRADLREDLRQISRLAGVRPARPLALLITDAQLVDETFLVAINDLLSASGVIPELFSNEELEAMTGSLRSAAKAKGIPDTKEQLLEFFHDRVRTNLHLVLAFSPVGPDLRVRCRRFPSLVSGACTINWFHPWPKEALVDVALSFLRDLSLTPSTDVGTAPNAQIDGEQELALDLEAVKATPEAVTLQENVCHHMADIHLSVTSASAEYACGVSARYNYVTPTSFLELIRFYRKLLARKRETRRVGIARLEVGLATLKKTAVDVARLQLELKQSLARVEERKAATDALLEQMGRQRGDAEIKQRRADEERAKAARAAEMASSIEAQASSELTHAKPALDAAQQAVNCLSKASLTELRSIGKPPPGVDKVTAAVLILVKNETKNLGWENAKRMMSKVEVFKQSLEQYDKEHIPPELIARVEPILEDPNFNYDKMKTKSMAAANLCVWVVNIVAFHHVYVRVKPLMDTLEEARRLKSEADTELAAVQKLVTEVEAQLARLQRSFREATNEKAKVEAEAQACQARLSLAERLVHGLAAENERWSHEIDVLRAGNAALVGDTLLAAAFVSYVGAFNARFRAQLWKHTWLPDLMAREIPITLMSSSSGSGGSSGGGGQEDSQGNGGNSTTTGSNAGRVGSTSSGKTAADVVDPVGMLSDNSTIAQWMNEGLPADRISIENGCIITACDRWPLLVDPQLQALTWLRARDYGTATSSADSEIVMSSATVSTTAAKAGASTSAGASTEPTANAVPLTTTEDTSAVVTASTTTMPATPNGGRRMSKFSLASRMASNRTVLSDKSGPSSGNSSRNLGSNDLTVGTGSHQGNNDGEPNSCGDNAVLSRKGTTRTLASRDTDTSAAGGGAGSALVVLQTSQKTWVRTLKNAIATGQSVMLESLGETLDAVLEPVLMRQCYRKGRHWFLRFAGDEIEYDLRFRLFLHTKLPNPHYRPEILAYCTLIDCSVTERGLEDQVLASVVRLEQPMLEKRKQRLQQDFNGYQIQLLQLEDQLLERLSNAPDDILSDVALIEGLEQTKQTANEVALALIKGRDAELEINLARDVYRPVASEASLIYFLMGQLCKVNHMYRYSLESFMTFFFVAMESVPPQDSSSEQGNNDASSDSSSSYAASVERVPLLKSALRWTLFVMVTRGLFEEHKLIFLTQLVLLLLRRGVIGNNATGYSDEHARFLLQGPKCVGPENPIAWLSETQWQSLQALIALDPFERFAADLEESEARFKEWYNTATPETEKLPLDWRELDKSAPFLKLLVVRCLRPDRLTQAISQFIATTLPRGAQYLTCDAQLNSYAVIKSSFAESMPWTPLYFILSPGTDVVADLDRLAVKDHARIKGVDYHNIAMGQGQEAIAMHKLQLSVKNGHWIILNNVHLMPAWLLELDKWLEQIAKASKTVSATTLRTSFSNASATSSSAGGGRGERGREGSSTALLTRTNTRVGAIGGLHPNFRLFITSDPSNQIPIGVLERSIKLTNEPPSGLKANVKRAFSCFPKNQVDELEPRTRVILVALCYFHSLMLERKKFGTQGFNMVYPFAASDLLASSVVLRNYMENVPARVPWTDLRYLFGEIMYGGHIVNESDRLVAATYLGYFLRDELLEELPMIPYGDDSNGGGASGSGGSGGGGGGDGGEVGGDGDGGLSGAANGSRREFLAPKLSAGFDRILDQMETSLGNDSPAAFGLHPNAEVAFRTAHGERLAHTILMLAKSDASAYDEEDGDEDDDEDRGVATRGGRGGVSSGGMGGDRGGGRGIGRGAATEPSADAAQMLVEGALQDILESYRDVRFDVNELFARTSLDAVTTESLARGGPVSGSSSVDRSDSVSLAVEEMDPYQTVLLQECERMNALLEEMTRSLIELEMGFRGDVTMTETMEALQTCLYLEKIPPSWEAVAYPSRRSLAPWLANVQARITQLQDWCGHAPELPVVLWLPGLFNPQSFLTAVLQTAARKHTLELDKLSITTDITKRVLEAIEAPSRDGQYVHGLALEGARWDIGNGILEPSHPKEMHVAMPVINCRALLSTRKEKDAVSGSGGAGGAVGVSSSSHSGGGGGGSDGNGGSGVAGGGTQNVYACPVYKTQQRGPTFVFTAQLRTKLPPAKWVLAGVALLMEVV